MIAVRPSRLVVAVIGIRLGFSRLALIGIDRGWDKLYELDDQRRMWSALGPLPFYPNAQTPATAYLVAPFTALPLPIAYGVWSLLTVALLLACWWLLAPGRDL